MGHGGEDGGRFSDLAETILEALDHAGIGMSITVRIDGELERLYANETGARILGYSLDEVHEMPPMAPVAPEELPRLHEIYERWAGGEDPPELVETVLLRRDGTRVPIELGLSVSTWRGHPATVAFLRDVSDRTRALEALEKSEARFRDLAESAPDVITVFAEGRCVYANRAAARTLGFPSPEAFMASSPSDWLDPEDVASMGDRLRRVLAGEQVSPREYTGRRQDDGTPVTVEISSIRTEFEGKPAVLAFGRDVDERKRLQAKLMQTDRMAAVGTLAAGVAHEVNNPLAYMLLNLRRAQQRLPELLPKDDRGAEMLQLVGGALEGAERVRVIVEDLLSLAGSRSQSVREVDVEATVRSAIKLAGPTLGARAALDTDLEPVPPVRADTARLGQVLLNLLINAVQAFEREDRARNRIRVSLRPLEPDCVVIEVSDNGVGIPSADMERVFDLFYTTKPAGAGTGLGLPLARSIVESFGGQLTLHSCEGEGTRVQVVLRTANGDTTDDD